MPATLTERFFGRMAFIGFPFQIYLDVELEGSLDAAALFTALRRAITDHPRLLVRLAPSRLGLRRWAAHAGSIAQERVIRRHPTSEALDERRGDPLDLELVGPVRLDIHERGLATRLVIALHHAMTDAQGAITFYERLAERYVEATGGGPVSPVVPSPDARRRRLLDRAPLRVRAAAVGAALSPFRELIPGARSRPSARFYDASTADGSVMHTRRATLPSTVVSALVRAAARRGASLNDVLVAAVTVAAQEVWPQSDDAPVGLDVPVNLRESSADVADHAGPFRFQIPAPVTRDFDATLAAVCERTRAARTRTPSIVQSFGSTIPSYLPPAMFDGGVGGFIRANPTGGDSLCVSNVGTLTGRLRDFGPLRLTDASVYANAPGLRMMILPSPRGLGLTFSYFSPLISDANVARVIAGTEARLAAFAGVANAASTTT